MSIDDFLESGSEPGTYKIRFETTEEMRTAAKFLVGKYETYMKITYGSPNAMKGVTPEKTAYESALDNFKEAVYQANPYLDPAVMTRTDEDNKVRPMFSQRIDMARASGKQLNDLIAEVAKAEKKRAPRPFEEAIRR